MIQLTEAGVDWHAFLPIFRREAIKTRTKRLENQQCLYGESDNFRSGLDPMMIPQCGGQYDDESRWFQSTRVSH